MLFLCAVTEGGLFEYHGGEAGEGIWEGWGSWNRQEWVMDGMMDGWMWDDSSKEYLWFIDEPSSDWFSALNYFDFSWHFSDKMKEQLRICSDTMDLLRPPKTSLAILERNWERGSFFSTLFMKRKWLETERKTLHLALTGAPTRNQSHCLKSTF